MLAPRNRVVRNHRLNLMHFRDRRRIKLLVDLQLWLPEIEFDKTGICYGNNTPNRPNSMVRRVEHRQHPTLQGLPSICTETVVDGRITVTRTGTVIVLMPSCDLQLWPILQLAMFLLTLQSGPDWMVI